MLLLFSHGWTTAKINKWARQRRRRRSLAHVTFRDLFTLFLFFQESLAYLVIMISSTTSFLLPVSPCSNTSVFCPSSLPRFLAIFLVLALPHILMVVGRGVMHMGQKSDRCLYVHAGHDTSSSSSSSSPSSSSSSSSSFSSSSSSSSP